MQTMIRMYHGQATFCLHWTYFKANIVTASNTVRVDKYFYTRCSQFFRENLTKNYVCSFIYIKRKLKCKCFGKKFTSTCLVIAEKWQVVSMDLLLISYTDKHRRLRFKPIFQFVLFYFKRIFCQNFISFLSSRILLTSEKQNLAGLDESNLHSK